MFGSGPILISHLKRGSLFDGGQPSSQKGSLFRGYPILAPHPERAAWMARGGVVPSWLRIPEVTPCLGRCPCLGSTPRPAPFSPDTPHSITITPDTIPPRPLPDLPSPDRCPFQTGPCPLTADSISDPSAALRSDGGEPGAGGLSFLWGCRCSFFHPTTPHFPSRSPKNW